MHSVGSQYSGLPLRQLRQMIFFLLNLGGPELQPFASSLALPPDRTDGARSTATVNTAVGTPRRSAGRLG